MKIKSLRDAKYSDFCILMDRATQFDLYKKVFTYLNIPLMVFKDENVASSNDILSIRSLLKLVLYIGNNDENEEFKYAFMSAGRSFIFNYSDDDLFSYIVNNTYKDTDLYKISYKYK
jgi:ATP-dependent helicase/nuclease subunit A